MFQRSYRGCCVIQRCFKSTAKPPGKYSSLEMPSSEPGEFSLKDIQDATDKANTLLNKSNVREKAVQRRQLKSMDSIGNEPVGESTEGEDVFNLRRINLMKEQIKKTHERAKTESTLPPFQQRVLKKYQNTPGKSNRYRYDEASGKVVDRLSPYEILKGVKRKPPKEDKRSEVEIVHQTLSKFPVNLILKSSSHGGVSLKIRELTNYIEKLNTEYTQKQSSLDINLIDPNDYELLLDYQIMARPDLLSDYISDTDNRETVVVQITEKGFSSSSDFLHKFSDSFQTNFELKACLLNTPKFPALTLIKKPESEMSDLENQTMEDNLYIIASLGLVKVTKRPDGSLILTHNNT